jgi:hypothetical protein
MACGSMHRVLLTFLMMCMAAPGLAAAGDARKDCSLLGTWFGTDPTTHVLTGWMVSVTGQSNNEGTNNLEYPVFDPTLGGGFSNAVRLSTLRGVWERTGGRTFAYSFMGMAVDTTNMPVWIGKVTGTIGLSEDCRTEAITASLAVYLPNVSPFDGAPYFTMPLPDHYGYRYELP